MQGIFRVSARSFSDRCGSAQFAVCVVSPATKISAIYTILGMKAYLPEGEVKRELEEYTKELSTKLGVNPSFLEGTPEELLEKAKDLHDKMHADLSNRLKGRVSAIPNPKHV